MKFNFSNLFSLLYSFIQGRFIADLLLVSIQVHLFHSAVNLCAGEIIVSARFRSNAKLAPIPVGWGELSRIFLEREKLF